MAKVSSEKTACAWCGGGVDQPHTGRPRRYCRDSHRQRAYEARKHGRRMGLVPGEVIVSSAALDRLGDRLTILEAALEDVEHDLQESSSRQDYRAAFRHLHGAATGLRGRRLRAIASARNRT